MEKLKQKKIKFEEWPAISASVGAVDSVLASIACERGLRGCCASVNDLAAWVTWVV